MGLKELIIPQEREFFDFLERISDRVREGAFELNELMLKNPSISAAAQYRKDIKQIEHDADETLHEIFLRLGRTFITPIDRVHITSLGTALDDVLDLIYAIVNRLFLYKIGKPDTYIRQMVEALTQSAEQLNAAVHAIRTKDKKAIEAAYVEINRIENLADELLNSGVANLFQKTKDPIQIMKLKEIYEKFEESTDKCEDAGDIIRDIMLEYM